MNLDLSRSVLQRLNVQGVSEVVVCAGARNSPLLQVLESSRGIKVYSFFEERSAGFFALGRMKAGAGPVAVITTSGTAVAELLPVVIESFYSGFPLVVLSADRPKSYRGSGAPQAIEQVGIFSTYVERTFDVSSPDELEDFKIASRPIHLNLCFDEPLLSGEDQPWEAASRPWVESLPEDAFEPFTVDSPLVIISTLSPLQTKFVGEVLSHWQVPVYREGTSGLRETPTDGFEVRNERELARIVESRECRSVIRIGGIPTLRFWRDLEGRFEKTAVYNFSEQSFAGLSRSVERHLPLSALTAVRFRENSVSKRDELVDTTELAQRWPQSEVNLFHRLSRLVGAEVFIGNSLPIREWDIAAARDRAVHVFANRGANGIDGQVSTFLGWAKEKKETWGIFGDLTTLYDLSAPWVLGELEGHARIVVMNNGGGQIFSRLFHNPKFRNHHQMDFKPWAEMWKMKHFEWREVPESFAYDGHCVIEVRPDEEQSQEFWREFDRQ